MMIMIMMMIIMMMMVRMMIIMIMMIITFNTDGESSTSRTCLQSGEAVTPISFSLKTELSKHGL
jgi:flagellar basal body-associated protein FliL